MYLGGVLCGLAPGDAFDATLRQQLEYLDALCRADGTIPAIGDDDSGRVLTLDPSGPAAGSVLDLGFALVPGAPRREAPEGPAPDLLWVGGEKSYSKWCRMTPAARGAGWRSFPVVGVHVRRAGDWHVTAVSGPERSIGSGGHLHADVLSVVAHVGGAERILDPGTLTYAVDRDVRDRFRSSRLHSTIAIPGIEPRPFLRQFRTGPGRIAEFGSRAKRWCWSSSSRRVAAQRAGSPSTRRAGSASTTSWTRARPAQSRWDSCSARRHPRYASAARERSGSASATRVANCASNARPRLR